MQTDLDEEEQDEVFKAQAREEAALKEEQAERDREEQRLLEERNSRAAELEQQLLDMHKNKTKVFSLQKDLERIQCGHFYQALLEAGFDDEGCFAEIDHAQLLEKGLCVEYRRAEHLPKNRALAFNTPNESPLDRFTNASVFSRCHHALYL